MKTLTNSELAAGVYFQAPKYYKTRPSTQAGSLLIPVWYREKVYHKYLLVTPTTKIFLDRKEQDEISFADFLEAKLIDRAKRYFVKGKNNMTNIQVDYLKIFC